MVADHQMYVRGQRLPRWATHVVRVRDHDGTERAIPAPTRGEADRIADAIRDHPRLRLFGERVGTHILRVSNTLEYRDEESDARDAAYERALYEWQTGGGWS